MSVADITDCATSPANNNNGVDVEDALDNDVAVNVEDVYDNNNSVEGVYADDESVDVVVENVYDNDDAGGVVFYCTCNNMHAAEDQLQVLKLSLKILTFTVCKTLLN